MRTNATKMQHHQLLHP